MSWLSSLFGGGKNPADAANQYLSQIPGQLQPYFQPYIAQGQQVNQQLVDQYNQMTQNPGQFYSSLGQNYKQSPGYQFKLQQALNAGTNAAAAGGMAGSPAHQQFAEQTANDIASQDYNDYIKNLLAIFGQGQAGQQGLQEQGYKAATGYGENIGSLLGQQGQYAFAGQAGKNANQAGLFGNALKLGSSFLPGLGNLQLLQPRSFG